MNRRITPVLLLAPLLMTSAAVPGDGSWTQEELEAVTATIQLEVEGLRKAKFKRPVDVKLIDGAGFLKYAIARMEETSTPEQFQAEEDITKMLGLIPAEMDLLQATLDLLEGQVGGFYDPVGNVFYLMEGFVGAVAKVILAHELTHALDDQWFDLNGGLESRLTNRDELSAYQAVVEGSGTVVMNSWSMGNISLFTPEELQKIQSMGTDSLAQAPPVLWKPLLASYMGGQQFLTKGLRMMKSKLKQVDRKLARKLSSADAITRAFENPPLSTEQILHPEKYWDESKRDDPQEVKVAIGLPAGWEQLDSTVLGEMQLALITEESKPVDFTNPMALMTIKYTNEAAAGWGGDRLALYGKEGARWLVVTTAWDSKKDADEFKAALEARLGTWRAQVAKLDPDGKGSGVGVKLEPDGTVTFDVWYGFDQGQL